MVSGDFHRTLANAFVGEGVSGHVRVSAPGQVTKYLIATNGQDTAKIYTRETHFLDQLQDVPYRVPKFFGASETLGQLQIGDKVIDYDHTITMEHIEDGQFLMQSEVLSPAVPASEQMEVVKSAAQLMADIHRSTPKREPSSFFVLRDMFDETFASDPRSRQRHGLYNAISTKLLNQRATGDEVFCHGDFCFNNMIFDPQSRTFTGVIDFAQSGFGMRETDMRHLNNLPRDLRALFMDEYERVSGVALDLDKMKMVDLISTLKHLVVAENMPYYPNQENEITALEGRLMRRAEEFYIYYPERLFQPPGTDVPKADR